MISGICNVTHINSAQMGGVNNGKIGKSIPPKLNRRDLGDAAIQGLLQQ